MYNSIRELPAKHRQFIGQSEVFVERVAERYGRHHPGSIEDASRVPPCPLFPTVVQNPNQATSAEREAIAKSYLGPDGVACFALRHCEPVLKRRHVLFSLVDQLSTTLPLAFPITHPLERHPDALKRFGEPDGTLKVYDVPISEKERDAGRYREVAETKELFAAHNDGLGSGGAVQAVALVMDSPPAWGGYTCFQNLIRLSLALRVSDPEAFEALFLPDAISAFRPRGKGALRVVGPVLYINDVGEPQSFFRVSSGEYVIEWRSDIAPLARAREVLLELAQPFAPSSTFVHMMHPGEGVIIRNTDVVHSRTRFENDVYGTQRILARKWFAPTAEKAPYRHVPALNVLSEYGALFPEYFADELLHGEWNWDPGTERNVPRFDKA